MKITKSKLKQIIKEELEDDFVDEPWHGINDKLVTASTSAIKTEIRGMLQSKGQIDMLGGENAELTKLLNDIVYDVEEPLMDVLAPVAQQIQNKISGLGLQLESIKRDAERAEAAQYQFSSMEDYDNWVLGGRLMVHRPDWKKKQDKLGQPEDDILPQDTEVPSVILSIEALEKIIQEEAIAMLKEGWTSPAPQSKGVGVPLGLARRARELPAIEPEADPRDDAYAAHSNRKRSALEGLADRINSLGLELQNVDPQSPDAWQEIRRIEREIQDLQDEMVNVGHGEF